MRRSLFFLLERLEINRSERIAVSILMILLVLGVSIWTFIKPYANYDEESYAELERIFAERSRIQQLEMESILARYDPANTQETLEARPNYLTVADTIQTDSTSQKENSSAAGSLININTATVQTLQELPGIGPAYARRIVEWRDQNGNFTSKEQLLEIRGIGEKRLSTIKPLITLQ